MFETYHYKGNFEFYFYPSNQTKLAKSLLPAIFPPDAIKKARGKKLEQYDRDLVFQKARNLLEFFQYWKPTLLQWHFKDQFSKDPEIVVLWYLILKRVAEEISFKASFQIESDLAQNILIDALEMKIGNE